MCLRRKKKNSSICKSITCISINSRQPPCHRMLRRLTVARVANVAEGFGPSLVYRAHGRSASRPRRGGGRLARTVSANPRETTVRGKVLKHLRVASNVKRAESSKKTVYNKPLARGESFCRCSRRLDLMACCSSCIRNSRIARVSPGSERPSSRCCTSNIAGPRLGRPRLRPVPRRGRWSSRRPSR